MTISTHRCEVIQISPGEYTAIPKADRIVFVMVHGGYPCVISKEDGDCGGLFCYLPPDSLVNIDRPEFSFLASDINVHVREDRCVRIKARKLMKQPSIGLLIAAPFGSKIGDDLADHFGVKHWEPATKQERLYKPKTRIEKIARMIFRRSMRYGEKPPGIQVPHYDVDALRRYKRAFDGRRVTVTEKIHGTNVAYCWQNRGLLHRLFHRKREQNLRVRSRTVWQAVWRGGRYVDACPPGVKEFLRIHPNCTVFGEIHGPKIQKNFEYNLEEPAFRAFDIRHNTGGLGWFSWSEFEMFCGIYDIPTVPMLYRGKFDFDHIEKLANIKASELDKYTLREGVVIQSDDGRYPRQLKLVSINYYLKGKDE